MAQILVVDDEEAVRNILSRFFTKKQYKVITAETSEQAISTLEREKVDAVLLDIQLPGLNGLETLRKIRATWPDVPVVMISGQQEEAVAKKARAQVGLAIATDPGRHPDRIEARERSPARLRARRGRLRGEASRSRIPGANRLHEASGAITLRPLPEAAELEPMDLLPSATEGFPATLP